MPKQQEDSNNRLTSPSNFYENEKQQEIGKK